MSWKPPTRPARTPNSRAELQEGGARGHPRPEHQKPRGSDRPAFARPTTQGDRLGPQPWDRARVRRLTPSHQASVAASDAYTFAVITLTGLVGHWAPRSAPPNSREEKLDQHPLFEGSGLVQLKVDVASGCPCPGRSARDVAEKAREPGLARSGVPADQNECGRRGAAGLRRLLSK